MTAQVFLVEAEVEHVAGAEPVDDEGGEAEFAGEEVEAGLVELADHFAEEHVDAAGPLLDDGVDAEDAREREQDGLRDEGADEGEQRGTEDGDDRLIGHLPASR